MWSVNSQLHEAPRPFVHRRLALKLPFVAQERPSDRQKAVSVACGGWHTAVIGEKGGVWTCGRGEYGRLGLGDEKSQV